MRRLLSLLALASLTLATSRADAYCRTTTCNPSEMGCKTDPKTGCVTEGVPLYWPNACLGISINQGTAPNISFDSFAAVARDSFATWQQITCDGKAPAVSLTMLGPVACADTGFNLDGYNANIVYFSSGMWQHDDSALALTTLTFNLDTGEIYDADMEINAAPSVGAVTTGDSNVRVDLQSVITHEAGHLLGLSHSNVRAATMYAEYSPGDTSLRSLDDDDRAAFCSIYAPAVAKGSGCDVERVASPSAGYSGECMATAASTPQALFGSIPAKQAPTAASVTKAPGSDSNSGCSCTTAPGAPVAALSPSLLAVAALALVRRRRRG